MDQPTCALKFGKIGIAVQEPEFLVSLPTRTSAHFKTSKPMANIFGILTAIVLAITAFVAFKNKEAYTRGISDTATEKNNLATSQNRFKTAQEGLAATNESQTGVDAEIVKLTEDLADRKKAVEDLKLQVESKTAKIQSNKTQLDEVRASTQVGDLNELADKMREASTEREELIQAVASTEATLANLTARNSEAESRATGIRTRLEILSSGQSLPTLNTRIRSIYPTWGFVTLADGNNAGVVANSTLDVVRGGETVAQLLVTAVERGSASASIIPDSAAGEVPLMVGDRVIAAAKDASKPVRN